MRNFLLIWLLCLSFGFLKTSQADYSFRVIVKYPFASLHYDTLGNIVSDSLCGFVLSHR